MSSPVISATRGAAVASALALFASLLGGCDNMKKQASLRAEAPSAHQPRRTSAQLAPAHTVPHRDPAPDSSLLCDERDGQFVADIPGGLTGALLARGRERFAIYCAVCHGPDGYGRGIVVQRGFPAPPSFHDARLRNAPAGYFFRVMTRGSGVMYPYADRLSTGDRWAVAAYIRALQLSQHVGVRDLPESDLAQLPLR